MVDKVSVEKRSQIMAAIRSKNTKPEIIIRKSLHALGFRFRIHDKTLPGSPDLVFPKYKAVILVHGCFWHGHDNCRIFKMPKSRVEFWNAKITRNQNRDKADLIKLRQSGWRVLTIWECSIIGKEKLVYSKLINKITSWLKKSKSNKTIRGTTNK